MAGGLSRRSIYLGNLDIGRPLQGETGDPGLERGEADGATDLTEIRTKAGVRCCGRRIVRRLSGLAVALVGIAVRDGLVDMPRQLSIMMRAGPNRREGTEEEHRRE